MKQSAMLLSFVLMNHILLGICFKILSWMCDEILHFIFKKVIYTFWWFEYKCTLLNASVVPYGKTVWPFLQNLNKEGEISCHKAGQFRLSFPIDSASPSTKFVSIAYGKVKV